MLVIIVEFFLLIYDLNYSYTQTHSLPLYMFI